MSYKWRQLSCVTEQTIKIEFSSRFGTIMMKIRHPLFFLPSKKFKYKDICLLWLVQYASLLFSGMIINALLTTCPKWKCAPLSGAAVERINVQHRRRLCTTACRRLKSCCCLIKPELVHGARNRIREKRTQSFILGIRFPCNRILAETDVFLFPSSKFREQPVLDQIARSGDRCDKFSGALLLL